MVPTPTLLVVVEPLVVTVSKVSDSAVRYVLVSSVPSALRNPPLLDAFTNDVAVSIPVTVTPPDLVASF